MPNALIILAAGLGARMKSDLPKALHEVAGAPMLIHAMAAGASLDPDRVIVVAGHGADAVTRAAHDYDDTARHRPAGRTAWHRARRTAGAA